MVAVALLNVAVSNVVLTLVVVILAPVVRIRRRPAAVASVASVVAATIPTRAVARSGKLAVTVGSAMTLPRNIVVEMDMVLFVIIIGPVVTLGVASRVKVAAMV